ncbi:Ycf48-like protein precursor [Planctomycetes bacterium Pan216]|uniref:Ycf48-like protein n=1 Tax=Kolteria novifilia TaxID=2527975 RepID=A0A518AXI1_9BACT|nr:Ycf48-like protein precursor [Planctomycetes bacterium Pan216]
MSHRFPWRPFLLGLTLGFLPAIPLHAQEHEDATLRGVVFVDQHEGWAVGDEGTIWHTLDGGEVWERQPADTKLTLSGITMRDRHLGWVAARKSSPFLKGSQGEVYWTRDGGKTWSKVAKQYFSGIQSVLFFDKRLGCIVGETTEQHPCGVFVTDDAGKNWNAVLGGQWPGWKASWFRDASFGVLGGIHGSFAVLRDGQLIPAPCDWSPNSTVHDIAEANGTIWAVGDRCQIFSSSDEGVTWARAETPIPREVRESWNLHSVSAVGDHVWIAGRPGSLVLHSPNKGRTWEILPTGSPMPLEDLCFVDESHGWAVGAMGTILATKDGGKQWTAQREGGSRAAVLWINRQGRDIPLSVAARLGAEEGYRQVAFELTVPERSLGSPGGLAASRRVNDALRQVGGTVAEHSNRFPLDPSRVNDPPNALIAEWNRLHEGKAGEEIERELILALRLWRPEIVITDDIVPGTHNPMASALVALGVRRCFRRAADPRVFPEQLAFLQLRPHQAKRLFAHVPSLEAPQAEGGEPAKGKTIVIDRLASKELGARLGKSYLEAANEAMPTLWPEFHSTEREARFGLLASDGERSVGRVTLMGSLQLQPGTEARRDVAPVAEEAIATDGSQETMREVVAAVQRLKIGNQSDATLAHLGTMTRDLPPSRAGSVLHETGMRYLRSGRWDLATQTFQYLVERFPEHPLALQASRWLMAYWTSIEAQRQAEDPTLLGTARAKYTRNESTGKTTTVGSSGVQLLHERGRTQRANIQAVAYGQHLQGSSRHLWSDPQIQLCLAAAHRKIGQLETREGHFRVILDADPASRWKDVINMERWLFDQARRCPRPTGRSVHAPKRPYLDGQLDDECWRHTKELVLGCEDEMTGEIFRTTVRFCHDDEFFYLGAIAGQPAARPGMEATPRRGHDANIAHSDRIEFLVDLDRDYSTWYRLSVNHEGQVRDECWGQPSWNPRWFVATASGQGYWSLETAIPITELTHDTGLTHQWWAFNVQRIVPGQKILAVSQPASAEGRSDGFTLMKFIQRDRRPDPVQQAN